MTRTSILYNAIVTMPPYAPYIREVLAHPLVSGIRLNTAMQVKNIEEAVTGMYKETQRYNKDLWIDLKGRQLRVKTFGVPPFTTIELAHNIKVKTPVTAYFSDGKESATVLKVDGNVLYMQQGPKRVVGPGESINIPDPSLEIEGYLTGTDLEYVSAAKKVGARKFMLSFVEAKEDIDALKTLVPDAQIAAKIESNKGLDYVQKEWKDDARLMTARGDLYLEVKMPHLITKAAEDIVKKDPDAIIASRIFDSLIKTGEPSCADVGDAENLMRMGYKTFMFGDHICLERDSIISGLNLLEAMTQEYARRT